MFLCFNYFKGLDNHTASENGFDLRQQQDMVADTFFEAVKYLYRIKNPDDLREIKTKADDVLHSVKSLARENQ